MDVCNIIFIVVMALIPIGFIVAVLVQDANHKKDMISMSIDNIFYYAKILKQ